MSDAAPEDGARFRVALRGYDKTEVDGAIKRLERRVQELEAERERLLADADQPTTAPDDLDQFGKDVAAVLAAARSAASDLVARTESETADAIATATAEAERLVAEASAAADRTVAEAKSAAEQAYQAGEEDVRILRAEAEREAHRLTSSAKKESDDLLRRARMEAERLSSDAIAERDRILGEAREAADAAQARAHALEVRRDELLSELESVRATVSRLEGEIDQKRAAIEAVPEPIDVVEPPDEASYDGVRIIPAAADDDDVDEGPVGEPVETMDVVEEVRRLHEVPPEPEVEVGSGPDLEETAEAEVEPEPAPEVEVEPVAAPEVEPEPEPADDLGGIFAALRGTAEEPAAVPATPDEAAGADHQAPPDEAELPPLHHNGDAEAAVEERDRRLIPITNGALRGVKRELADAQNHALEGLRNDPDGWRPARTELAEHFDPSLVVVRDQARRAGIEWALSVLDADVKVPGTASGDGSAMAGDLAASLERAVGRGADGAARSAEVSRVFRSWRADSAERHLRSEAAHAYHEGIRDAAAAAGASTRLVVLRSCPACAEAAEASELAIPPVHDGCRCVLVPAR